MMFNISCMIQKVTLCHATAAHHTKCLLAAPEDAIGDSVLEGPPDAEKSECCLYRTVDGNFPLADSTQVEPHWAVGSADRDSHANMKICSGTPSC